MNVLSRLAPPRSPSTRTAPDTRRMSLEGTPLPEFLQHFLERRLTRLDYEFCRRNGRCDPGERKRQPRTAPCLIGQVTAGEQCHARSKNSTCAHNEKQLRRSQHSFFHGCDLLAKSLQFP